MGGLGSGQRQRKRTIGECLALCVWDFSRRGALVVGAFGDMTWEEEGHRPCAVGFRVAGSAQGPQALELAYDVTVDGRCEPVEMEVPLEVQAAGFGGRRFWFRCPRCHDRRARIYLPPGTTQFACRASSCHDLTHKSVQEHDARIDRLRRDWPGLCRMGAALTPSSPFPILAFIAWRKGPLLCTRTRKPREREA